MEYNANIHINQLISSLYYKLTKLMKNKTKHFSSISKFLIVTLLDKYQLKQNFKCLVQIKYSNTHPASKGKTIKCMVPRKPQYGRLCTIFTLTSSSANKFICESFPCKCPEISRAKEDGLLTQNVQIFWCLWILQLYGITHTKLFRLVKLSKFRSSNLTAELFIALRQLSLK